MVRAEITPVTDNSYAHPDDEMVRCLLSVFVYVSPLLDGHLVYVLFPLVLSFTIHHISLYKFIGL